MEKEFELSLNKNETEDRASLIMINFLPNTKIKKDGKILIDLRNVEKKIDNFDKYNKYGYQICYHYDNFQDFSFQKMEDITRLNFEKLYIQYNEEVDHMYDILIQLLKKENIDEAKNLIGKLNCIYEGKKYKLESIIKEKYVYGKKILEEELNKECYYDFIFKILFVILFTENISEEEEKFKIDDLKHIQNIHDKLLDNKKRLDNDKLLKIYEKIFLLVDVYSLELLNKEDYIIHYFHIKNIEDKSPLFYAYEFLHNFVKELNYDSNFYYPLLSIDGGLYDYFYKKKHGFEYLSTYGFNMLSLDKIKDHLQNLIPDILIWSEYIKDNNAETNPLNGNVILNIKQFEKIKIDKNELDEIESKHYGFILSKILIHELFGHKKSSFSKLRKNTNSIISFRNENGELILINSNDNNLFKYISVISNGEDPYSLKGDSGYFIEYFLGKINNEYTLAVIDTIEKYTNLSKLLNPILWHKDFSTFKEYLKLKSICLELFKENNINNNDPIEKQIELMKKEINGEGKEIEDKKIEDKKSNEKDGVKREENEKIDNLFKVY